jgi:hypothetical protein
VPDAAHAASFEEAIGLALTCENHDLTMLFLDVYARYFLPFLSIPTKTGRKRRFVATWWSGLRPCASRIKLGLSCRPSKPCAWPTKWTRSSGSSRQVCLRSIKVTAQGQILKRKYPTYTSVPV